MMQKMKLKILVPVLLSMLLISTGAFAQIEDLPSLPSEDKHPIFDKLEGVLYQLAQAEDYVDFAQAHGLYVADDKVRVVIELANPEYNLPSDFGTEETRYEDLLQALVHINKLLELADDPNVKYIRTPLSSEPEGGGAILQKIPIYAYYTGWVGVIAILFWIGYSWKKQK